MKSKNCLKVSIGGVMKKRNKNGGNNPNTDFVSVMAISPFVIMYHQ